MKNSPVNGTRKTLFTGYFYFVLKTLEKSTTRIKVGSLSWIDCMNSGSIYKKSGMPPTILNPFVTVKKLTIRPCNDLRYVGKKKNKKKNKKEKQQQQLKAFLPISEDEQELAINY
ncbi:hypothetical protein [Metabacillus niabensis]